MERVNNNTVRLKVWKATSSWPAARARTGFRLHAFREISVYDQRDVQGFVKLYTLRLLPGAPAHRK